MKMKYLAVMLAMLEVDGSGALWSFWGKLLLSKRESLPIKTEVSSLLWHPFNQKYYLLNPLSFKNEEQPMSLLNQQYPHLCVCTIVQPSCMIL
jgi:hypothetical protein